MHANRNIILVVAWVAALGSGVLAGRGGNRAQIDGRVVHENGQSIAGATVQLTGDNGTTFTKTDRRGTFRFSKLAPGRYTVTAFVLEPFAPPVFVPDFVGSVVVDADGREKITVVVHPVD